MKNSLFLVLNFAATVLVGCSSTHIQSVRHPAGLGVPPFRNVTVIGMDERQWVRNPFENDVVALLQARGVEGTASYTLLSFNELKGDKEQLRRRLLAAKAESVLFVRVTARTDFVDGPPATLGGMDMGAVDESQYVAFTAGGQDINTRFRLGARVYRVSDGAVIWSAALDTVMKEDSAPTDFIQRTAKTIVEQMAKDEVIP